MVKQTKQQITESSLPSRETITKCNKKVLLVLKLGKNHVTGPLNTICDDFGCLKVNLKSTLSCTDTSEANQIGLQSRFSIFFILKVGLANIDLKISKYQREDKFKLFRSYKANYTTNKTSLLSQEMITKCNKNLRLVFLVTFTSVFAESRSICKTHITSYE